MAAVGEHKDVPEWTPDAYNSLPWVSFQTKKGQTWQRFSCAQDCGTKNQIKDNLISLCVKDPDGNEATISAPYQVYEYGYWLFNDWIYRRPMKGPK
jgi:hypothetical protein